MTRRTAMFGLAGVAMILMSFPAGLISNREESEIRHIGIPDGAAGLLVRYVLQEKLGEHSMQTVRFEPHTLYDCCASTTQYALGSGHIDIAIMCPDSAQALVAKDKRFKIIGPTMINSDVLITRLDVDLQHPDIGISDKREFQRQMVTKRFGDQATAVPMLHSALPFAYARGVIQGAILDITKVFCLEGYLDESAAKDRSICTYVMVVNKTLQQSGTYTLFLENYGQAVKEMDNPHNLLRLLQVYESPNISMGDVLKWQKMNVRFTNPLQSPRHDLIW